MANLVGGSVVWNLDVDQSKFDRGLQKASADIDKTADKGKKTFGRFANDVSGSFNSIANTIASTAKRVALFAVTGSIGIGAFVKSAADLQVTSKSFEVLIGNARTANKVFAEIKRFADRTPFEFSQLASASRILLGYGISASDVMKRLKMLGDITAVTGADLNSLAVVFGQVNAAGRLMGQDALQLINNNIPLTNILTKKLGVSSKQLRKEIELGNVSSQLFVEALEDVTKKGGFAFKGTDVLARTLTGRISTLKDAVFEFGRRLIGIKVDPKLGFVIKPGGLFDAMTKLVPRATQALEDFTPTMERFVDFIVRNAGNIKSILVGIAAGFVAAKIAAIGFKIAAMAAEGTLKRNLIVGAIILAITALVALQDKFNWVGKTIEFVKGIIEDVSDALSNVRDWFKRVGDRVAEITAGIKQNIAETVGAIVDRVQAMVQAVQDRFNQLVAFIKRVPRNIINFFAQIPQGVMNHFKFLLEDIPKQFQAIIDSVKQLVKNVTGFFTTVFNSVVSFFRSLPGVLASAFTSAFNTVKTWIGNVINSFANMFTSMVDNAKQWASNVGSAISNGFKNIVDGIVGFFTELPSRLASWFNSIISTVKGFFRTVPEEARKTVANTFNEQRRNWIITIGKYLLIFLVGAVAFIGLQLVDLGLRIVRFIVDGIRRGPALIVSAIQNFPRLIGNVFNRVKGMIVAPFKLAFNAIAKLWNNTVGRISFKAPSWVPGIGGKGWAMPKIPELAEGGIISRPTVALLGEGNESEVVMPLSKIGEVLDDVKGQQSQTINQTNNIYTEIDMNKVLSDMAWRLSN